MQKNISQPRTNKTYNDVRVSMNKNYRITCKNISSLWLNMYIVTLVTFLPPINNYQNQCNISKCNEKDELVLDQSIEYSCSPVICSQPFMEQKITQFSGNYYDLTTIYQILAKKLHNITFVDNTSYTTISMNTVTSSKMEHSISITLLSFIFLFDFFYCHVC